MDIQASIRKCPHGIYWPADQKICLYCQFCNPKINDHEATDVMRAVEVRHRYGVADRKISNPSKSVCPECGCDIHFVLKNGEWACADCDHKWRGKAA